MNFSPAIVLVLLLTIISCRTTESNLRSESTSTNLNPIPTVEKFEIVPEDEAAYTSKMIQAMVAKTKKIDKFGYAPRASAQKTHGCVLADFEVVNQASISPSDAVHFLGLFQPGQKYKSWIRFSNSKGLSAGANGYDYDHDSVPDGRNMSIKVMNIPNRGENDQFLKKISTPDEWEQMEKNTFDFELINYPAFFSSSMKNMVELSFTMPARESFDSDNEFQWALGVWFGNFKKNIEIQEASRSDGSLSPFDNTYHSMTPYLLGEEAVKYSVEPTVCGSNDSRAVTKMTELESKERDYLRQSMREKMEEGDACFGVNIHVRRDGTLPIEDPTVIWDEKRAPKIRVAHIRIPKQTFDSDKQMNFCENLSYTIWNTLPEHQPLGGINRARLHIYKVVSSHRIMKENGNQRFEPTGENDVERFPVPLP